MGFGVILNDPPKMVHRSTQILEKLIKFTKNHVDKSKKNSNAKTKKNLLRSKLNKLPKKKPKSLNLSIALVVVQRSLIKLKNA